ncbi:MAG: hypothetical protein H7321_06890, partial [Bacteroidia bacterium]|nr:hypothetical protein [Bacteroidia bacterium]
MKNTIRYFLVTLTVFALSNISAQIKFVAADTFPISKGARMVTDNLNNVYVISINNDIDKYNKDGKKIATTNFKVLGNIASLDATNPFEIYVFYRDQNKVVFLDNMLSFRGEVDLEQAGFSQVAALSRSYDNGIWLFDMADLKLKKLTKDLQSVLESNNLLTYTDKSLSPNFILDNNQSIFVNNPLSGIMQFDVFGNYNKTLPFDSLSSIQIVNDQFVFISGNALHAYD